jgi:hypothetical protein
MSPPAAVFCAASADQSSLSMPGSLESRKSSAASREAERVLDLPAVPVAPEHDAGVGRHDSEAVKGLSRSYGAL